MNLSSTNKDIRKRFSNWKTESSSNSSLLKTEQRPINIFEDESWKKEIIGGMPSAVL
jgi:hypothetical protein